MKTLAEAERAAKDNKPNDTAQVLTALAFAIPLWVWHAYAFTRLWAWFVVPLGMEPVTKAHAMGLMAMLAAYCRYSAPYESRTWDWAYVRKWAIKHIFGPLGILTVGAIARWLMT